MGIGGLPGDPCTGKVRDMAACGRVEREMDEAMILLVSCRTWKWVR
jgi:hypothetical protein